jgi:hypothetical protein
MTVKLKRYNIDPNTNSLVEHEEGRFCLAPDAIEAVRVSVTQSVNLANAVNHMAIAFNLISAPTYDVLKLVTIIHVVSESFADIAKEAGLTLEHDKKPKLDS